MHLFWRRRPPGPRARRSTKPPRSAEDEADPGSRALAVFLWNAARLREPGLGRIPLERSQTAGAGPWRHSSGTQTDCGSRALAARPRGSLLRTTRSAVCGASATAGESPAVFRSTLFRSTRGDRATSFGREHRLLSRAEDPRGAFWRGASRSRPLGRRHIRIGRAAAPDAEKRRKRSAPQARQKGGRRGANPSSDRGRGIGKTEKDHKRPEGSAGKAEGAIPYSTPVIRP